MRNIRYRRLYNVTEFDRSCAESLLTLAFNSKLLRSDAGAIRKMVLYRFEGILSKSFEYVCKNVMHQVKADIRQRKLQSKL